MVIGVERHGNDARVPRAVNSTLSTSLTYADVVMDKGEYTEAHQLIT
jgi:hypothetical protein